MNRELVRAESEHGARRAAAADEYQLPERWNHVDWIRIKVAKKVGTSGFLKLPQLNCCEH